MKTKGVLNFNDINIPPEALAAARRLMASSGGKATLAVYGPKHFSALQKKSLTARVARKLMAKGKLSTDVEKA